MMEQLVQRFYEKYAQTKTDTIRDFVNVVDWKNRMIGIKGERGVGKTTLLLQYIKQNFQPDNKVLYVSLDHFYFSEIRIYQLADEFQKKGGKTLILDEVHRYLNWAQELKNIYDDFPDLNIIFTGSSLIHLQNANADLSRRAIMYEMPGLSFREFVLFETTKRFPVFTLEQIFNDHIQIAIDLKAQFKPLEYINAYIRHGYYPFYLENLNAFFYKLIETLQLVVEVDIPQFKNIQTSHIGYIKKLLQIIASSVPFKPNLNAISQRTGISLNTLKTYLMYLNKAGLIATIHTTAKGINSLNKPEKLYFGNTNMMYSLSSGKPEIGNIRETFIFSQLRPVAKVNASPQADFLINGKYTIEIGGVNKNKKQIKEIPDAFIVKDNIEIGYENVIPLWMFGFLY